MNCSKMVSPVPTVSLLCFLLFTGVMSLPLPVEADITLERYDPIGELPPYRWCTQLYFNQGKEIAVDLKNSRILYRTEGTGKFVASSLPLLRPHSIVYNPIDQLYYIADTDNNRIIAFDSPENPHIESSTSTIAGIELDRPHDMVFDPENEWLYAINPLPVVIFRFKAIGKEESSLDLSDYLGYSRSLTFSKGKLYVIGSSKGKVVEITDFDQAIFNIYQSPGKFKIAPEGNWKQTGLVLNDVEYFKNYWYASSYFCPSDSSTGQDFNENKLIRFKTWEQFEKGEWQDLSNKVPNALVPYYLTVHRDHLYIPLYNHQIPGKGDCIFQLSDE